MTEPLPSLSAWVAIHSEDSGAETWPYSCVKQLIDQLGDGAPTDKARRHIVPPSQEVGCRSVLLQRRGFLEDVGVS